jgi:hypothetical protein
MSKGDKFLALTTYLKNCEKDELKLSFSDIEKIIGFRLSDSAYLYPAQWSNSESQSFAFGWLNAGYLTRFVNIQEQTVEFVKEQVESKTKVASNSKKGPSSKAISITKTVPFSKVANFPVYEAIRCILAYFNETVRDPNGRYLSWQHCYNAFTVNRVSRDEDTLDYLALHLGFYLASWGMYRGSSFLFQKDYKVHLPIVKIIKEERYNPLVGIKAEDLIKDENLNLLEDISNRIHKAYADEIPSLAGVPNNATDTLLSKILLGTFGCVPAYDRCYVQAVKKYNISTGVFGKESIRDIAKYYLSYKDNFESMRKELSSRGTEYPAMKLMDMCMWQAGFEESNTMS